jgi:hypothetical protein
LRLIESEQEHKLSLSDLQVNIATRRVEHQRRLVAQLALHNYPAERAQSVLADYEGTLQRIRQDQAKPAVSFVMAHELY